MEWLRRYAGGLTLVAAIGGYVAVKSHETVLGGLLVLFIGVVGLAFALTEDIAAIGAEMLRRHRAVGRLLIGCRPRWRGSWCA